MVRCHCAVLTWPGLLTALTECIRNEVAATAGKKRPPRASMARTLRLFVSKAEEKGKLNHRRILLEVLLPRSSDSLDFNGGSQPVI